MAELPEAPESTAAGAAKGFLRAGELAVINERCGAKAVDDCKRRWLKKMTPYRRVRDAATLVSMMALRSQGFGIVHKEQDVLWIETELLMGGERVTEDKARLLDLGVTHILKCQPAYPNQFGEDFIYCRCFVNDSEKTRQDVLRVEFAMGLQFASEALDLGGRVLVTCPSGTRCSAAAVIALLMRKRHTRLSTATQLVRLHEPDMKITRSLALFLSLYEIELQHETSVKRNRVYTNPSLKQLVEELEIPIALPWPLPLQMLAGAALIPDPYAFWYGKPKTDHRGCFRRYCGCFFWDGPFKVAYQGLRALVVALTTKREEAELPVEADEETVATQGTIVSAGAVVYDEMSLTSETSRITAPGGLDDSVEDLGSLDTLGSTLAEGTKKSKAARRRAAKRQRLESQVVQVAPKPDARVAPADNDLDDIASDVTLDPGLGKRALDDVDSKAGGDSDSVSSKGSAGSLFSRSSKGSKGSFGSLFSRSSKGSKGSKDTQGSKVSTRSAKKAGKSPELSSVPEGMFGSPQKPGGARRQSIPEKALRFLPKRMTHRERQITITY